MRAAPAACPAILGCTAGFALALAVPVFFHAQPPAAPPRPLVIPVASCGQPVVLDGAVAPPLPHRQLRT